MAQKGGLERILNHVFCPFRSLSLFFSQPQVLITVSLRTASLNVSGQAVTHVTVLPTLISSPAPASARTLHGQTSQSPRFLSARCQDCKKSGIVWSYLPFGSFLLCNLWKVPWPLWALESSVKWGSWFLTHRAFVYKIQMELWLVGPCFLHGVCQGHRLEVHLDYLLEGVQGHI